MAASNLTYALGSNFTASPFSSDSGLDVVNNSNDSTLGGHYNVSEPHGLHWLATASALSVSSSALDVTVTSSSAGQGQPTVMMLGHMMANGVNDNQTMSPGEAFAQRKNHTVMVSCLMFGGGVVGNLLALFVLATSSADQRKTLFYKLVAGLAVTDLLGTVATSPVVIAVYLNDLRWTGGDAMCHYFSFAMIWAGFATMLIVCAMSVERYVCVRHPYIYHTRLSGTKFARLTLLTCWALSTSIASLPLLGVGTNVKHYPRTWCFFDYTSREPSDVAFNFIYAITALCCVIVTFVCNVSVIYTLVTLRSRQSRLDASETAGSAGRRRHRATSQRFAEVQMMLMLIGITIVFTACFAPLMIFVLVCQTELQFDSGKWVLLLIRLASFNPILDPWVYILCRRELVWRVVKLGRCLLRLPPLPPPQRQYLLPQQSLLVKDPALTMAFSNGVGGEEGGGGGGERKNGVTSNGKGVVVNPPNTLMTSSGALLTSKPAPVGRWEDPYNPSCLAFCYQCVCLPPAPRVSASVMSHHRLSVTTYTRSPSLRAMPALGSASSQSPRKTLSLDHLNATAAARGSPGRHLVNRTPSPCDRLLLVKMVEGSAGGSARSLNSVV